MIHWRGAQVAPSASIESVQELVDRKANIIRYQATVGPESNDWDADHWLQWWRYHLIYVAHLQNTFPELKIVLSLHTPPGGYNADGTMALFSTKPWAADTLIEGWKIAAEELKGNIRFFDLLNEPAGTVAQSNEIQEKLRLAIRVLDPKQRIIISTNYGNPQHFKYLHFVKDDYLLYTAHFYAPMSFTHQGIYDYPTGKKYPRLLTGFTKTRLKYYMSQIVAFKKKYGARIFIGEFSCCNYADERSRYTYLRDVINLFETYGFEWCYHAWREHPVWQPSLHVENLLKSYWGKNI